MMPALTETLVVETPENISLEFEVAGLGSRFLAFLVDTVMQALILLMAFYVGSLVLAAVAGVFRINGMAGSLQTTLMILSAFVVYECYFVYFEMRLHGQSIGKKLLNLRVVKDGGHPIVFMDSAIRNILRVIDALPPLFFFPSYGLGSAVIMCNRQSKRLGDFVAGTIVIKERSMTGFEHFAAIRTNPEHLRRLRLTHLQRMQDTDKYILREFFFRKNTFPPPVRDTIASKLAARFRKRLEIPADLYNNNVRLLDDLMLLLESRRS